MFFSRKYKVKKISADIETHEIFLDKLARAEEEKLGLSEKKFEVRIGERAIYIIFAVFFISVSIVFSKTFYLQTFKGKYFYNLSENNKSKIGLIRAERGIIYDKNFEKLVLNSPAYDLVCDKRNFSGKESEYDKEIMILSELLKDDYETIKKIITNSEDASVLIKENISHEILLILEARIGEAPDCRIEKNTARSYVFGPVFSHVLGYVGRVGEEDLKNNNYSVNDYSGKTGLEKHYEGVLSGIPGKVQIIKNAMGVKRGDEILSNPQRGHNLVLNIDLNFQKKVYEALEKSIKNIGSKKGAAVALDPRNGSILALVSYPAYDNNVFSGGISAADFNKLQRDPYQPFFNRAIAAKYPTGSTIKPFLASAALQEKIISPEKKINDPGYILVQSKYDPSVIYKFGGVEPHGFVDMREAIAVSSNIYFYTIGGGYGDQKGLGPSLIKKYLDLFGWEEKTGIDLPGEFGGFIPDPEWKKQAKNESWWDGDTYNLSIGQSDLQVTPLQVASAYAAIANGGTLYEPQIVGKIVDGSGENSKTITEFQPEIIRQNFISSDNLKIIREGMRDGVVRGSSSTLNNLPVKVAGKTGTVETGKDGIFNTWSSNFAPYDDPEIVFVATIEGVQGLRAATLPVAYDVLKYYFSNK